jgi:hypothetical protein
LKSARRRNICSCARQAKNQFEIARGREIKNEYRRFERKNIARRRNRSIGAASEGGTSGENSNAQRSRTRFAYKIEGSPRIIKAKPSERAVVGYEFANQYVRYQLKQPECVCGTSRQFTEITPTARSGKEFF